jgi:PHD/YefM family antitoxin component YafN of YafNO toxin-antitoxin module
MQTLPAHEIKRRGVAAIEEILDRGPIRILKHNRPACVVLSEAEYQSLCRRGGAVPKRTAWEILLAAPREPGRSREQIDAELGAERDGWDRS